MTILGIRKAKKIQSTPINNPTYQYGKKSKKKRIKPTNDEIIKIFKTFSDFTSMKSESSFLTMSSTVLESEKLNFWLKVSKLEKTSQKIKAPIANASMKCIFSLSAK